MFQSMKHFLSIEKLTLAEIESPGEIFMLVICTGGFGYISHQA